MDSATLLLVAVVVLALIFDYINGFHDSANAIATVVSTKVMPPVTAVVYGGILNFIGAMMGTQVAATIGQGLVATQAITMETVICAVIGAIVWDLLTWIRGLPTSSSHALVGSLAGAAAASAAGGLHAISWTAIGAKIILPMILSPLLGITFGYIIMFLLTWAIHKGSLFKINRTFGRLQIVSAGFMALSHGTNDAQKSMGIIALSLMLTFHHAFYVPVWVKIACALAMGLGTLSGGWRIIRTIGSKMIHLQPTQGFAAETTAAAIISTASHFGLPVSTTHVITSSIMGVGAVQRLSAVRWGVVGNIVWAWVLTLPLTFAFSAGLMLLYRAIAHF